MNKQHELEREILKGVSRSFYLSLRLLPAAMRRPAGIAYLFARASDTIADSTTLDTAQRLSFLDSYARQVAGLSRDEKWPKQLIHSTPDSREKRLLECHTSILAAFQQLDPHCIDLIREVLEIIISGQRLDLERFGDSTAAKITSLVDADALDDYTWRVAGCVGVFWTKLGFATLGKNFSPQSSVVLEKLGREYGSALQLVNILRDVTSDLRAGRCYFPVNDPSQETQLLEEWERWRKLALLRVEAGFQYATHLKSKRLRVATVLPARIAKEMLQLMKYASLADLEKGIRISRSRLYSIILREFIFG